MSTRSPIDDFLEEQARLTAVDRFSNEYEGGGVPGNAKYYRDLIPLSFPKAGEQYAFEIDLDACTGCKACVTACHRLNGLDEHETWREVGLLVGGPDRMPFQQTVTTTCHHCVDPGCLNGCPVEAYEKDALTGIVRHLDDQCIGCQYCLWKCPYEVPQYSESRGIVRKCDLCQSRLANGEAPACVQACPNAAIRITVVEKEAIRNEFAGSRGTDALTDFESRTLNSGPANRPFTPAATNRFLPDSPAPQITLPTTRYRTSRQQPSNLRAADHFKIRPQPAHWPLIIMLVLTQLSVGLFALDLILRCILPVRLALPAGHSVPLIALGAGVCGLAASVAHLGRPLQAWRCFLGWRTSWLSREVMAFGLFMAMALAWVLCNWAGIRSRAIEVGLSLATVLSGVLSVFCSVMVYADTQREFWCLSHTAGRFFGSAAILAAAVVFVCGPVLQLPQQILGGLAITIAASTALKLAAEMRMFRNLSVDLNDPWLTPLQRSAFLLRGPLGLLARSRRLVAFLGGLVMPLGWWIGEGHISLAVGVIVLCLVAEFSERYLFFAAVAPAKMPGGL
jgi:Fe-S-cluster-containing dehydrogenase component/DMSO reductase anchor subunit